MPTLYAWAESPTAATIFRAAAAVDTSKATIRRWRGSIGFSDDHCLVYRVLVELGYGSQQRQVGGLVEVQADLLQSSLFEAQCAGGVAGEIDDPAVHNGTPVIDANHHGHAVPQVGDLDERAQR